LRKTTLRQAGLTKWLFFAILQALKIQGNAGFFEDIWLYGCIRGVALTKKPICDKVLCR
jgi:hypothetical protein